MKNQKVGRRIIKARRARGRAVLSTSVAPKNYSQRTRATAFADPIESPLRRSFSRILRNGRTQVEQIFSSFYCKRGRATKARLGISLGRRVDKRASETQQNKKDRQGKLSCARTIARTSGHYCFAEAGMRRYVKTRDSCASYNLC